MAAHKPIDPELLGRAQAGELRRSNTTPGSVERRAVDRVMYLRRRAASPEVSARRALGHRPAPSPATMSTILAGRGFVVVENPSRLERSRIGRYDSLTGQLRWGQLDPRAFQRRVRRWRPIRGGSFESDPNIVLAILASRADAGDELFIYEGRRA